MGVLRVFFGVVWVFLFFFLSKKQQRYSNMKKQKLNPRINLFLDAVKLLKTRGCTNFVI